MSDVFISYSSKDARFARQLAESLSKAGIDVWIDVDDIPVGMKWSTAVMQGLKLCQVMIVVITPDAMTSRNVEDEWQYFLDKNKPVVPVLRKPTEIHFQLNRIQRIDFYSEDYETALQYLFLELESRGVNLAPGTIVARPTIIGRRPESISTRKPFKRQGGSRRLLAMRVALLVILISGAAFILMNRSDRIEQAATQTVVVPSPAQDATERQETNNALERGTPTEERTPTPSRTPTLTMTPTALSATATIAATETPAVSIQANDPVNVRSGDDPDLRLVDILQRGQEAEVLGVNRFGTWYYIEFTDVDSGEVKRGWVSAPFVTVKGDPSGLPELNMSSAAALP